MLAVFLSLIDDEPSRTLFEQVYLGHVHTMIHVARNVLHDYMLAEDAVHDAFLHIMDHLDAITEADSTRTRAYVVLITRNVAINYYRKQKRRAESNLDEFSDYLSTEQPDPEVVLMQKEKFQELLASISRLKPALADVISLKVVFGYSDDEIARLRDITPSNVRVRLHRARRSLALDMLEEDT
jgi:RNA polymerase sigma-70 factor (ECF subfamily)